MIREGNEGAYEKEEWKKIRNRGRNPAHGSAYDSNWKKISE